MVRTLDDITRQAQQGSVAAIIQVLNADLAESGVRARAVLSQGILQLLCEADNSNKLNQTTLVEQLQAKLNAIQPRYVRRVRVNTRLVSEQQLLWLDEIERDPDGQLLWTAEFSIQRPHLTQQLRNTWSNWQGRNSASGGVLADTAQRERRKRRLWQATIGSSGLILFLGIAGWVAYDFFNLGQRPQATTIAPEADGSTLPVVDSLSNPANPDPDDPNPASSNPANADENPESESMVASNIPAATDPDNPQPVSTTGSQPSDTQTNPAQPDPFVLAVRIAEQSVVGGQVATTADEWLELATQWQRASELMNSVPAEDDRYAIAQDRTTVYLQNSVDSRKQAELARQRQDEQPAQPL